MQVLFSQTVEYNTLQITVSNINVSFHNINSVNYGPKKKAAVSVQKTDTLNV